eukprot:c18318_g1_i4.p1 GENE.c18318_g1_i4~~c18318_g1_i4.p1  ORF type:complete len:312 (+),score=35.35 c18318_g1_i4:61-936(+)
MKQAIAHQLTAQITRFLSIRLPRQKVGDNNTGQRQAVSATAMFGIEPKGPVIDSNGTQYFDIVIVGGGMASLYAVKELAQGMAFPGEYSVVVVSREGQLPFSSAQMVQMMAENQDLNASIIENESWFLANRITFLLKTEVSSIDVQQRLVTCEPRRGARFRLRATSALILATGARPNSGPPVKHLDDPTPRSPPLTLPVDGIFTLRSLEVAHSLTRCLETAKHLVVVGGGFLGLDMVHVATRRGVSVTLVAGSRLLNKIFTPAMSEKYKLCLETQGVRVVTVNLDAYSCCD